MTETGTKEKHPEMLPKFGPRHVLPRNELGGVNVVGLLADISASTRVVRLMSKTLFER